MTSLSNLAGRIADTAGGRADQAQGEMAEFLLLGALSSVLGPDDLSRSLDDAVELLRRALGADDCELFLGEPGGGDMLLAACAGAERDAFLSRERFRPGRGYPGLVAATGRPLTTPRLARDRRFLRGAVTRSGIRSYLCVPVRGRTAPLGCLSLAWKGGDVPFEAMGHLLERASRPLGMAIRAGLSAARESVRVLLGGGAQSPEARRGALLEAIAGAAGARRATMILGSGMLGSGKAGGEPLVVSTAASASTCEGALAGGALACPLLAGGHGQVLGACRHEWPRPCQRLGPTTVAPCCLPLRVEDELQGVLVLDYGSAPPTPRHRNLVPLLAMAREGAAWLLPAGRRAPVRPPQPTLELHCLGGFEVRLRGRVLPGEAFARRKARSLLGLLVLQAGQPIPRDDLASRLWPGVEPRAGANRLHGVVHALRAAIEPFHRERRWIFVQNQGEFYRFNPDSPHWIDLHSFEHLAARGLLALAEGREQDAVDGLQGALQLYRGDFFADEADAEWCAQARIELQRSCLDLTLRLAELHAARGEPERSVECLRHGLRIDPLREDLHQALIQTLFENGRRQEALEQYRICAGALREELGIEPLPATRRLQRVLAARPP